MSFEIFYLGAFDPSGAAGGNAATSTAGSLFQTGLLDALVGSSLPRPTVYCYFPVPSYPISKSLFHLPRSVHMQNGLAARSLAHVNLGALKIVTLGLSAAWATFKWGVKNRGRRRVVVSYNLNAPPAYFVAPVCRMLGMEFVPFVGDIYVPGEVVSDGWMRRLEFALQTRLIAKADGLLVCNKAIVDDFAPGRRHLVLEGGVLESVVRSFSPRISDQGGFHVVFAGQLSELNGVRLLLEALPLCSAPGLRVSVLGGGALEKEVREYAAKDTRLSFEGRVTHQRVLDAYRSADLLVNLRSTQFVTHRYVFPSKVVECLATGVPLLSTRTGHVEEEFGAFVFLLEEESARALARAIEFVASLPHESRRNIGRCAQEYVLRNKTWEAHLERLSAYLTKRTKILAFVDYYLPGYKGGGPAVSVSRRAALHAGRSEFMIFTRDRDLGSESPYDSVRAGEWNERDEARVFYARPDELGVFQVLWVLRSVRPDVIYLNSFFSRMTRAVLLLRWFGLVKAKSVVLAPRGELSRGALSIKALRKRAYLAISKRVGLYRSLGWQATAEPERRDIAREIGEVPVTVEREAAPQIHVGDHDRPDKRSGHCKFVFLSRVSRMKNLEFTVRAMGQLTGDVELHVYGPIEDERYWAECQREVAQLPPNVTVKVHGGLPQSVVPKTLSSHHVFVLSTHGENFCHVIAEALASGLPCVISDRTPWSDMDAAGAGRVVPLEDPAAWARALQEFVDMDGASYRAAVQCVRGYYSSRLKGEHGGAGSYLFPEGVRAA